jgi:hypothetical protein
MANRLSSTPEWVARSPAVAACIQCGRTPTPAAAAAVVTARALAIPRAHPWDFNSIYQHVVRARHIPAARSVHRSRVYAQQGSSDDSRTGRALPLEAVTQPDLGIAAIMASIMRGDRPVSLVHLRMLVATSPPPPHLRPLCRKQQRFCAPPPSPPSSCPARRACLSIHDCTATCHKQCPPLAQAV